MAKRKQQPRGRKTANRGGGKLAARPAARKQPKGRTKSPASTTVRATGSRADAPILVVGIGASAGGLEACSQLLEHIPAGSGMAVVLVQHMAPNHESMLAQLLAP